MDKIDQAIKDYLVRNRGVRFGRRDKGLYPSTEEFYSFIADELEGAELERMLSHLAIHPEDQELVSKARELLKSERESERTEVPIELSRKVKNLVSGTAKLMCPHCGKAITPFKRPPQRQVFWNLLWMGAGAVSFILSFVFHRYFLQFLALGLFFGMKWVVDQKATKTQIMIYKALEQDQEKPSHSGHRVGSHL